MLCKHGMYFWKDVHISKRVCKIHPKTSIVTKEENIEKKMLVLVDQGPLLNQVGVRYVYKNVINLLIHV